MSAADIRKVCFAEVVFFHFSDALPSYLSRTCSLKAGKTGYKKAGMVFSLSLKYSLLVFIGVVGVLQAVASYHNWRGMLFFFNRYQRTKDDVHKYWNADSQNRSSEYDKSGHNKGNPCCIDGMS